MKQISQEDKVRQLDKALSEMEDACEAVMSYLESLIEVLKDSPVVGVMREKQKIWMQFRQLFNELNSQRPDKNFNRLSRLRFKVDHMSVLLKRLSEKSQQLTDMEEEQLKQSLTRIEGTGIEGGFSKLHQKAYAVLDVLPDYFPIDRTMPNKFWESSGETCDVVSLRVEGNSIWAESMPLTKGSIEDAFFKIRLMELLERFSHFSVETNPPSVLDDTRFTTKHLESSFLPELWKIASDFAQAELSFTVTLNATLEQDNEKSTNAG